MLTIKLINVRYLPRTSTNVIIKFDINLIDRGVYISRTTVNSVSLEITVIAKKRCEKTYVHLD